VARADGHERRPLAELTRQFGRLGLTTFGGPAAHIAMFRHEFVARRGWLADREFLDLLSAANLIPGPTSTELAMHIGHRRAGWAGLVVAGIAFASPAVLIVAILAWVYVTWGALPAVGAVLAGIAPVVVAIVAHATVGLGRTAVRGPLTVAIAGLAIAASLAGVPEVAILLAAGIGGLLALGGRPGAGGPKTQLPGGAIGPLLAAAGPLAATAPLAASAPLGLFLAFLKIGSILFGSGYLLVALLRSEFVVATGLLTERQLLDAVAVGQLTPGPVFTTATFIGYLLLGLPGAVIATVGMALPAFGFVAMSVPVLERLRGSLAARAVLDGVGAAVVGLLVAVVVALSRTAATAPLWAIVGIGAFGLLLTGRLGPVVLLAVGAAIGAASGLGEGLLGWVLPR
jgi:chromate transporter